MFFINAILFLLLLLLFFRCVTFSFAALGQGIGWEEGLRNDLFFVEWDAKP